MPISASIRRARRASVAAGAARCSRPVPERSSTASSIETGSTAGVTSASSARTSRLTAPYFRMSGRTTAASGQARSAWNIGIAERTPKARAS